MEGLLTVKVNLREGKGRVSCSGRSGFHPFWCWTDSPVQTEAGGSLGCSLEAHGWISRLQTDTEYWGGGRRNGFICNPCLSAVLCKVFRQNTKLHLPAHVKEGTQLPKWGKKSSITAGSYYEPDTRAPVNTFLSLREAVISLFFAYFQLLEWTPGLRNTASALPAQFPARSSSLTGAARKWPWQGLWCSYGHSSLCYMGSFRQCCAALSPIHLPIQVLLICWLTNLQRHYAELRIPADSITVKGQGGSGLRLQAQAPVLSVFCWFFFLHSNLKISCNWPKLW